MFTIKGNIAGLKRAVFWVAGRCDEIQSIAGGAQWGATTATSAGRQRGPLAGGGVGLPAPGNQSKQ